MAKVRDDRGRLGPTNDEEVDDEYEQSPHFRGFSLPETAFLILTSVKAGLFTAIVTAFALDAMSNLDEDTSTQLLRILVEQATAGQAIDIPQPRPPSSAVMVSSLWFLSIMSSLAATTWAILSLEWCAFLTEGDQAEDYEEMAEKRQRRFEAIRRWKMHLIVSSIPFFLHVSLFLFLAGLWLRLRDVNKQLELIVGIPSLVIALSYVVVSLLPVFTEAPFSTSFSELIHPLVKEIKYLVRLRHFVHPPPVIKWILRSLKLVTGRFFPRLDPADRRRLYSPLRVAAALLIRLLKWTYKFTGPLAYESWTVTTRILRTIFPAFHPGGDPFKELNRLQIGRSDRDKGIHQRALIWLMNTPLTQDEVREVLKKVSDLHGLGNVEQSLDRAIVKLLVLSLSSVLENGRITEDEQPIFDHCTRLLTEEMGRTFRDAKYDPRILARNTAISNELRKYVYFDTSTTPPPSPRDAYDDYWNKVVRLLWLSPSEEQIQVVIERLERSVRSVGPTLLQRIVRGLHAATLTSLMANKQRSIIHFPLLDLSQWQLSDDDPTNGDESTAEDGSDDGDWSTSERPDLEKELSAFLQNLLVTFHKTAQPVGQKHKNPSTIPSLIVNCLKLLDSHPRGDVPLKLHRALCSFIIMKWRNDPRVFNADPSVAQALVTSIKDFVANSPQDTPNRSEKIAIRLHAVANGPKSVSSWQHMSLSENIADLYADPLKDDPRCLSEYIHVTAAVLEAVLVRESLPGVQELRRHIDRWAVRVSPLFFTDGLAFNFSRNNPDHRLPYLYSLAIALSRGIGGTGHNSLEVLRLLSTSGEKRGNAAAIEKMLDTNTLAVNVLRRTLPRRTEPVIADADVQTHLDPITRALRPLQGIIEDRTYPRRTRWKAIYVLADIRSILPRSLTGFEGLQTLVNDTSGAVRSYIDEQLQDEPAPYDWKLKKDGLGICGLEEAVRGLARVNESTKGVYSWREPGNIPYLSLYSQRTRHDLTSQAPYRLLEKLQRRVFSWVGSGKAYLTDTDILQVC